MSQYQIAVVTGSLRWDHSTSKLADALIKLGSLEFAFRPCAWMGISGRCECR